MAIKKLKSGRWQVDYTLNTKRYRKSFATENEAKIHMLGIDATRLGTNNQPSAADDSKISILTCLSAWKQWLVTRNRSPKYIKRIEYSIKNLEPFLNQNNIITVAQLTKWHIDLYFQKRTSEGAKQQTIINEFRNLHAALNWAQSRDIIKINKIAKYKPETPKHSIPDVPNPQSLQKIFDSLDNPDARKIFYFILAVGSRFAETIELRAEDIQNNTILFHRNTKFGYQRYVKLPPLPFELPENGLLFTLQRRKWKNRTLLRYIERACETANVPRINIHTLRHAHATFSLAIGGPENSLQEIMVRCGWRSLNMLTRYMEKQRSFNITQYLPIWTEKSGMTRKRTRKTKNINKKTKNLDTTLTL